MIEIFKKKRNKTIITIVILITVMTIVVFPANYQVEVEETAYKEGDNSNVPYVASVAIDTAISEVKNMGAVNTKQQDLKVVNLGESGYKLDIDLDVLTDDIIKTLDKNGSNIDNYLSEQNKREYLKKMIKAEMITQYPDLRSVAKIGTPVTDEKEFQGAIKFIRHKSDNTQQVMEYMPLGDPETLEDTYLYGLINQANQIAGVTDVQAQAARDKISNYFSLDASGNVVIVKYIESINQTVEGNYEDKYRDYEAINLYYFYKDKNRFIKPVEERKYIYEIQKVNYQSALSQYSMPFEYLWAFLVSGRDEQFVSDLADLVLNSKIEISIYDSARTDETKMIESWNTNTWERERTDRRRTSSRGEVEIEKGEWKEATITTVHNYRITYTKTYYNTVHLAVTKADIWYMLQTVEYIYEKTVPTDISLEKYNTVRRDDKDGEFTDPDSFDVPIIFGKWEEIENIPNMERRRVSQKQVMNNYHMESIAQNTIEYKYTINGDPIVTEKTSKKVKEGEEGYPNFCTIFLNSESARNNILGAEDRLFNILAKNEATVNMVDLTKYLLYKTTNQNYGITTYDFTPIVTIDTTQKVYRGTVEPQVWAALTQAGYSLEASAGVMANIYYESQFYTNNLDNSYEEKLGYTDDTYTEAVDNDTYKDFMYDRAGYGLAGWTSYSRKNKLYNLVKSEGTSISNPKVQIEYLLTEIGEDSTVMGNYYGYDRNAWLNATTPEEAAVAFCASFKGTENTIADGQMRRAKAREYYDKYKEFKNGEVLVNENITQDGYSGIYTSSTGKTYKEYKQYLGLWKDKEYYTGTMTNYGCSCTAVAIIASAYDSSITPEEIRVTKLSGYNTINITSYFVTHKIECEQVWDTGKTMEDKIKKHLLNGGSVLVHVNSKSSYTTSEHWMAVLDINEYGDTVYISDPGSINNNGWQSLSKLMVGLDRAVFVK